MSDLAAAHDAAELARKELRAWLDEHFTPEVREAVAHRYEGDVHVDPFEAQRAWNATLFDGGWAAPRGRQRSVVRDAGILEQLALNEEMDRAGAPGPVNAIGVANIAPAIMTYGTPEQQERFLRPMLRGDHIWSQGMSEPEAGSDLASLRCRGELDGDDVVVTGQKTWNSNGDKAHWCQLYVRTDSSGPKHQGITCLLVDMSLPGIEVRPIRTMAGDSGFAEVFFDEVRIPRTALLGEVGEGWNVATRTLSNERAGVATLYLHLRRKLDRLIEEAGQPGPDGRVPTDSPLVRDALAARYTDVRVLELLAKRMLGAMIAGRMPGPEGSVIKLAWGSTDQKLAATAVDVLGLPALTGSWGWNLLGSRSLTIAGGTTEVNKNIIGERVLGLPKEPKP
ncbi:MAG: acyl-CoA dehydrogenase family protein [Acidimicrobiales bacterium]